ncbi:MAG: ABC transporter permease [Planctomycetota bacterium]|nr:ABC transporter permease [Planctomycetota bacterium]MDA1163908.1 ABC transporter permease [Planctomycetota bacterium]
MSSSSELPGDQESTRGSETDTEPAALGHKPSASQIRMSNVLFYLLFVVMGGTYVVLIIGMLLADAAYMAERTVDGLTSEGRSLLSVVSHNPIVTALADERIQYSVWLSLISCSMSAVISVLIAIPMGYLISRHEFRGKKLLDAVVDIPIVLPPLVIGLSLLILFQFPPFRWFARDVVYQVPSVVLAQFSVACAFAVRTMKATFDHINPRCEDVAITLGCSRAQAFGWVLLPEAQRGILTAFTLAWARSLGEFGPLLIFSGATRMKTEVLSTSVFLEMNVGDIEAAVAVSFIMVMAAVVVLILTRLIGSEHQAIH